MNTLIENLNALMTVKKELNKVLVDNEQPGGPVFDTYPEQFRELFRVLEDKLDDIEEGPYATYQPETVVARPIIGFENNVVTLTCATQGAEIHFRTKDVYGNVQGDSNYVGRFSISRDTWIETYAILNGVRSSKPDNSRWCYYQAGGAVPAPEFDRTNGIVTITCRQQGAQIWWRIMPSTTFILYTGPELVDGTKWLEAYAVYQGKGSETAISEGTEEGITVADPVLTCTDNVVTITCATEDAVIWYKTNLDGEWTIYTEPIEISVDTEFTAYAYKEGNISNTVTESFEYEEPYVPPVVVPADPVISCSNNVVTITCSTSGATIYYSTDNGVTYNEYTGTITISADTTFYAYSELNGETSNTVSYEAEYEDTPQPVAPADPVISCTNNVVTITCSTSGAVIWYSTDGGNTYNIYTEPITISADTTFYAYSTKDGLISNMVGPYEAEYDDSYYNEHEYLYIEAITSGQFKFYFYDTYLEDERNARTIYVSKDKTNWTSIKASGQGGNTTVNVSAGQKLYLKANNNYSFANINNIIYWEGGNAGVYGFCWEHRIHFTGNYNLGGNIMSLLYGDNFVGEYTVGLQRFVGLFSTDHPMISSSAYNNLKDCSKLVLPATTLGSGCYTGLFFRQSGITKTPKLPATVLADYCYYDMFKKCSALTEAPVLSATTLSYYCYEGMFINCTSLVNAPILPAATLSSYCYRRMFVGCTRLNYIKCLATDISATDCIEQWVENISSSGTFVKKTSVTWPTGTSGIPQNWIVQETND